MSEPKVIPLIAPIGARYESLTEDSRLINGFVEKGQAQDIHIYKRPGFRLLSIATAGLGQGNFNWQDYVYAVVGGTVYKNNTPLAGTVNATAKYEFTSCLGATPKLFLNNGVAAYTIDAADTITQVDGAANFPADFLPDCVYIDGGIYIFDPVSGIHGSDFNDPGTWEADNLIIAQIEPDFSVGLRKQLSYVIALKQYYTEVFYDAGNPTGSPLGPVQGAKMNFGCIDRRTIADVGGDLIWVARTREGSVSVALVSSLKLQTISTAPIERILQAADYTGNVYSWAAKVDGHRFYGVTVVNSNFTLVYDLTSGFWYQWTDWEGNYLPFCSTAIGAENRVIFQHESNGRTYDLDIARLQDSEGTFPVTIYTPNFDGGTRQEKTLNRLDVFGDQASGSTIELSWSDDDYQTWATARTIDMSLDAPFTSDLGSFRKRAFRIHHQSNTKFRLRAIQPYLALGSL